MSVTNKWSATYGEGVLLGHYGEGVDLPSRHDIRCLKNSRTNYEVLTLRDFVLIMLSYPVLRIKLGTSHMRA